MGPGLLLAAAGLGGLMLYAKKKGGSQIYAVSDDVAKQNLSQASAMLYSESRPAVLVQMANALDLQAANASPTMAAKLTAAAAALRARATALGG